MNREDHQTIVQILTETVLSDHLFQIPVGCCENTDIDLNGIMASDSFDLLFLKNTEQFNLHFQGLFTDLIKKYGAGIGQFKKTDLAIFIGAGKGTPLIAEQFAFDQVGRDGTAVDADIRLILTAAVLVNIKSFTLKKKTVVPPPVP